MLTYCLLLEGEVHIDQPYRDASDLDPPVLHVELMNTPVVNEETGQEISDHLYVYWKNGAERMERAGVQGGTIPLRIGNKAAVEPYGWANAEYQAARWFVNSLTSSMVHPRQQYRKRVL